MVVLFLLALFSYSSCQQCESGWQYFEGNCYKYYNTPTQTGTYDELNARCQAVNALIAPGNNKSEFMQLYSQSSGGSNGVVWSDKRAAIDYVLLGVRKSSTNFNEFVTDSEEVASMPWCAGEPNNISDPEECVQIIPLATPCANDISCGPYFPAGKRFYRFFCKKRSAADSPCMKVNKSLSVLFIVDSSSSIGEKNWNYIVKFLRSGAKYITNKARVGFIKYGTNVTYSKWVNAGWDVKEFKRKVPEVYDDGETNTAAALNEAVQMFKKDESRSQVAVLITDGLPFTTEYKDNKEEALSITQNAANQLLESSAYLIALGYGKELHKNDGEKFLKNLLEDPREDYFEFGKEAYDLKESHMASLLKKVCRRFV